MDDDVFICGHCGKEMVRDVDKIVYGCYRLVTGNIHCAYLCENCFDDVEAISWSNDLGE